MLWSDLVEYEEYINSHAWRVKRLGYFQNREKRCLGCGTTSEAIQLHHVTYERLGSELDSDLRALCQKCHSFIHSIHSANNGNLSLLEATEQALGFISVKRNAKRQTRLIRQLTQLQEEKARKTAKNRKRKARKLERRKQMV